jgi:hypothetical protein
MKSEEARLSDIAAVSADDLWTVGSDGSGSALILHYSCAR